MPGDAQSTHPHSDHDALIRRIHASLSKADAYTQHQRRLNSTLTLVATLGSAMTAFITALTAIEGPVVIPGLLEWQSACAIGAVLSLVTTVCSGLSQQMNISQNFSLGSQCVGRLRALDLVAATQTRSVGDVTMEYAEILKTYSEIISD
ncbi:MAG: hypothetical protein AB1649_33625 [Chloroflexota bacterium]